MIKGAICAVLSIVIIIILYQPVKNILVTAEKSHYQELSKNSTLQVQFGGFEFISRKILGLPTTINASRGIVT
jgi:hypothetical protein